MLVIILIRFHISHWRIDYFMSSMLGLVTRAVELELLSIYAWALWTSWCNLIFKKIKPNFHLVFQKRLQRTMEHSQRSTFPTKEYFSLSQNAQSYLIYCEASLVGIYWIRIYYYQSLQSHFYCKGNNSDF